MIGSECPICSGRLTTSGYCTNCAVYPPGEIGQVYDERRQGEDGEIGRRIT